MSKMSEIDMDRRLLDVMDAMREPEETAELQIERRCDFILREMDEFCAMALNNETVDLIQNERIAFGQILLRAELIRGFLMSSQPHLRVIR